MSGTGVPVVLGIDVGGSGARVAMRRVGDDARTPRRLEGERAGVSAKGSTAADAALTLVARALEAWAPATGDGGEDAIVGVAVGATGLASLVNAPEDLAARLSHLVGERTGRRPSVAVAIDAVTAHLGALGGGAGAVVALGTGAIALGGDGHARWHRVDGWGHLLGDRGGGAWIGLRGLEAAMRAHDGVDDAGAALLALARTAWGDPPSWPGRIYTRDDRAGVLAAFAPSVARLADDGDAAARQIMWDAGHEAARSAAAALVTPLPPVVAATGGVVRAGGALDASFRLTLARLRPGVVVRAAAGDPLDGALLLAERAAAGAVSRHPSYVWTA